MDVLLAERANAAMCWSFRRDAGVTVLAPKGVGLDFLLAERALPH
jgi:hypothetical protein